MFPLAMEQNRSSDLLSEIEWSISSTECPSMFDMRLTIISIVAYI